MNKFNKPNTSFNKPVKFAPLVKSKSKSLIIVPNNNVKNNKFQEDKQIIKPIEQYIIPIEPLETIKPEIIEIIETEIVEPEPIITMPQIYVKPEEIPLKSSLTEQKKNNKKAFADAIKIIVLKQRNGWNV